MNDGSLWVTLAGIFFVGLSLNLTPCVYPMLSITVSLFGGSQEMNRARAFVKALVYVLGIATMYSSLGILAAFTGGFFGSFLQNRWVLIGVSVVFLLLALSLFGVYAFQAPSWLLTKAGSRKVTGLLGIYISGLLVGIFAAPCIGPSIVALLALVGTKGDPVFAFLVFFTMSMGLGVPYLLLGTYSSLIRRLPKSGMWMVWVEKLFGTVLLGLAGFYFTLAVYPNVLKWVPVMTLIAGGIYLGFIEHSTQYSKNFLKIKRGIGVLAVIAGIAIPVLSPRQSVQWEIYTPEKFAQSKAAHKPVLMDFYADWCIPCHELDRYTYSDPAVIKALEGYDRYKVNLTDADAPNAQAAIGQFGILGVPTILFLDAEGKEVRDARSSGFVAPKDFLQVIRCAGTPAARGDAFKQCLKAPV